MRLGRQQQRFDRESLADAIGHSQIGQQTPYGSVRYEGEIGSPDRRQIVELNSQDQARLNQQRAIQSQLLSLVLGGGGGMAGGGKQGQRQAMPTPRGMRMGPQSPDVRVRNPQMRSRATLADYLGEG